MTRWPYGERPTPSVAKLAERILAELAMDKWTGREPVILLDVKICTVRELKSLCAALTAPDKRKKSK